MDKLYNKELEISEDDIRSSNSIKDLCHWQEELLKQKAKVEHNIMGVTGNHYEGKKKKIKMFGYLRIIKIMLVMISNRRSQISNDITIWQAIKFKITG
jgi:hypothetical protein